MQEQVRQAGLVDVLDDDDDDHDVVAISVGGG